MKLVGGNQQKIISELIDYLDVAAFDPALWSGFTQILSDRTDNAKVIFQVIDNQHFNCMKLQTHGFMDSTIQNYVDHYITVSPWRDAILQTPEAVPIWTDQLMLARDYHRSEFYSDLLRPEGHADSSTGMNIIKEKERLAILALHYDSKISEIQHWKASYILSSLQKDLKKAVNINRLLNVEVPDATPSGEFSLANIKLASFIIDSATRVISINDALLQFIEKYDFLKIGAENKLSFSDPEMQASFLAKVHSFSASILSASDADYADLRISHHGAIFRFSFFPMNRTHKVADFRGIVAHNSSINMFMVIIGVQKSRDLHQDLSALLHKSYSLTKSEIRVINYLLDGNTLLAISQLTNTSIHTVRTHLKSIFQKMNIRRQQDLIAYVHLLRQQVSG